MIAKQYFKVFFWLFLAALLYMSLSPVPAVTPSIQNIDKMVHAGAYGLLFALAVKAYNARLPLWALAVATMVFGVSMEWAQSLTGYRYGEPMDMVANGTGIAIMWLLVILIRRYRAQ
jgi:VanZ family protein